MNLTCELGGDGGDEDLACAELCSERTLRGLGSRTCGSEGCTCELEDMFRRLCGSGVKNEHLTIARVAERKRVASVVERMYGVYSLESR